MGGSPLPQYKENEMKLIDRYVTEVGKNLPLVKGRKDMENELRSTLEDMLEDRAQKAGDLPMRRWRSNCSRNTARRKPSRRRTTRIRI
jgi:hypothetical protein